VKAGQSHLRREQWAGLRPVHGMQALGVRLGKGLNRVFARKDRLMSARFHAHVLRDPLATNHLGHGIPLRFARSGLLRTVVNALAFSP